MKDYKNIASENTTLSLPPDGYSRFFVIVRLLQEIFGATNKTLSILDVGGCSPYLYECLENSGIKFKLTIIDILPRPIGLNSNAQYIQEDITKSNLDEGTFDVVVSTDVLEHISKELKNEFVSATVRLSNKLVIIAAPFETEGVDEAEHIVNDFNKKLFGVGQDWLEEHFKYTKPSVDEIESVLKKMNVTYEHFGANNLYSWVFSAHMNLIQAKMGLDENLLRNVRSSYNQKLSESIEFSEPTYRHFFVIFKDKEIKVKNILSRIVLPTKAGVYTQYIHGMMDLVSEQIRDHKTSLALTKEVVSDLEQQLINEKIHTFKVQTELNMLKAKLKDKQLKNKIKKLRHPRSVARSVARKVIK